MSRTDSRDGIMDEVGIAEQAVTREACAKSGEGHTTEISSMTFLDSLRCNVHSAVAEHGDRQKAIHRVAVTVRLRRTRSGIWHRQFETQ